MEGLTLEDLNFEDDGKVFDAFATPDGDVKPDESKDIAVPETNNTPVSEDAAIAVPESVATSNNDNQGQADKATDKVDANSSSPKLNDSEQLYSTLASHLITKGALSDLDPSTIKSVDDLNEAIQQEAEKRLDSTQKAILEAKQVGAPVDAVAQAAQNVNDLEAITPQDIKEDPELAFNLIRQDFVNKGYDANRASTMAQRSIDAGEGLADAEFALKSITDSEKSRHAGIIKAAQDQEVESLEDIKKMLANDENTMANIKLNTEQQQQVYKQMTTDTGNRESSFIKYQRENPVSSRVKLETIFYLTKGLTDFSVFGTTAKTEATSDLEALLRGTSFTEDGKVQTVIKDDKASFTLADLKDLEIG
tara:strand:+ start:226 stop:1317 length:1092 start_codon:yes stop_codon:yes gene_type:complete